ncbi:uncharacterized protein LOC127565219 isoform X9 [Drosophila albomicans]|uniref:Uncharacterized protein LOC127565219 isoform X9 n=1 Tax=Drosophila albomicans TaxID=7291 RepID=A0A9C6WD84_DROAB|nr:uncharacterized protein LOC127565219 isoform X9 [Drosophila albomicans]
MATSTLTAAATPSAASVKNPQLKRVVYSKYRELLGSYNDKANAIIETLPAYMVREDRGFQLELPMAVHCNDKSSADIYGQRGGGAVGGGGYEAPACVQNAMMTKDKKPFTYTPGGIDLSQIRSERMAKRLARNAQAEGAGTGAAQQNRPSPQSPGGNVASSMGAAAMGMPFQVLPPPPPPQPQSGKNGNHAAPTAAPPPPPPQQSTLAPPGRGSAPGSPATTRKSPTPQRFEPPPLGFRPEIKIPSNPMAALRKVPPPVEKNTFWKDEYCKERSKSPLPESTQNPNANGYNSSNNNNNNNNNSYDAVDGEQRETIKPTNGGSNNYSNGNDNNNSINSYSPYTPTQVQQQQPQQQQLHQQSQQPQSPSPKTPPLQQQQQQWQPTPPATPPQQTRQEFRSVPMPTSPAVNVYTRQSDSPRSPFEQQHQQQQQERATESPFRFAQMQQQLQQQQQLQRPPAAVSPLAQPQQKPRPPTAVSPLTHPQQSRSPTAISPLAQQQPQQQQQQPQASSSVPWRTQRTPQQQQQQQHPQPIYNNVQQQQQQPSQQQRSRDIFSPAKTEQIQQSYDNQESQYQGAKPTNVGSLYIAPLQQPVEPQAQRLLLQQQQQSGARDSPMRQLPQQQQQQQPQQIGGQPLRWLSSQPQAKEQAPWARPEENGNVMPSSLRQPAQSAGATQVQPTTGYYQPQPQPQPQQVVQGNGYGTSSSPGQTSQHNFGSNAQQSGLRLQINTNSISNNASQTGPRERIIPITLEQTPTYAAAQPNFGGYNNYPASATAQQQFVSNNNNNNNIVNSNGNNNSTRIIPIAIEGGRGGPVSQSPVILQNDPRSPPIQSKSFRILQKITDTVDDGSGSDGRQDSPQSTRQTQLDVEPPQLQRPQFARQMSAQQARNSPTIEQMRRLQIAQDQQSGTPTVWSPQGNGVSTQNRFTPQRSLYDSSQQPQQQQFIPASEQQAPEPKKYTGSAIPSRSFKILQAMTTPENAEHKIHTELDSDLENVELNENNNHNNNNNYNNHNNNITCNNTGNNENNSNSNHNREINNKMNKRHSYTSSTSTPTPTPPPNSNTSNTYSSNSSISSDSSAPAKPQPERSQSVPPHYPYAFGYPYPWYMPPPPPQSVPGQSANREPPQVLNWPYPYPYPPPLPPSGDAKQGDVYPPYGYYYPYYLPPPPAYGQSCPPGDAHQPQNYPPFMPPYGPYAYPVAPSFSQSSTESRSSSVLPDIIITPSTDDVPSQVIMQHHIKVEPREPPKRAHSVEIEEVSSRPKSRSICTNKEQVIDMLSQRLANINKIAGGNTQDNLSKQLQKNYAGEMAKELGARSPSENDTEDSSDDDDDDSNTPKYGATNAAPSPLQAIKSVTNVNIFKGLSNIPVQQLDSESEDDDEDDDDDVTTADEMYDEEEQVEEEHEHLIEEIEDEYVVEEDLSVIYEEESELERSSDYAKTVIKRNDSSMSDATIADRQGDDEDNLDKLIEDNDNGEDDDESNSVTVRLPLRFSFSRSSNDENIATVQVGSTTQSEEKRQSIDNKRNSFSVAKVESEDEDDDDCEVSVTISLSNSSRSNSVDKSCPPVVDKITGRRTSNEDVTTSFSLGMRNKFSTDILNGDVTNNIVKSEPTMEVAEDESPAAPKEEFDFFATLMATKMQAQKMMEQSKNYWKTPETKTVEQPKEATQQTDCLKLRNKEQESEGKLRPKSGDLSKTQASLEAAKNSFWSTFATAAKEPEPIVESEQQEEDIDFWASIDESKNDSQWTKKKKTVTYTPLKKETVSTIEHWTTTLKARVEILPEAQCGTLHFVVEEKPKVVEASADEEEDFWASVEQAKSEAKILKVTEKVAQDSGANQDEQKTKSDFWDNRAADAPNEELVEEAIQQIVEDEQIDFWSDMETCQPDNQPNHFEFDPTKYPEEPREVDTDEEIDFWAEIEAKREPDDDDVTFHKSATFWARKERQNSVEEAPYKPMETKAFRAKLPDEPAIEIDVWATLEAARGEEPVIVDPVVEEEHTLAAQYEELEHESEEELPKETSVEETAKGEVPETNLHLVDTMSLASMHEPATVHTWTPYAPNNEETAEINNEPDFWADMEEERTKKEQIEEAEQKRQNYRQAMAFFNTSIDEQKVEKKTTTQQCPRNSGLQEIEEFEDADINIDLGPPGVYEIVGEENDIVDQNTIESVEAAEEERGAVTPTNFVPQLPEVYVEPESEAEPEKLKNLLPNGLPDLGVEKFNETPKISVRDRINVFEISPPSGDNKNTSNKVLTVQSLSVDSGRGKGQLSRNSSTQRSESEIEEDDSGVTDMNRQLSETDTESESFPELRKMTSYQRAATHSRLFKLLQDENDLPEGAQTGQVDEFQFKPSRRKIVHNVSITRRQNPSAVTEAETMTERRERLSLPLRKNTSIDADNPSTPNSPASPIVGPSVSKQRVVSDKLVNELVQSLLLKSDSTHLRNLPMERLQAAAKRALVEEMDSVENSSLDSTPAITPKQDNEYSDYYSSWTDASGGEEIVPSKAFRALQDPRRSPWTVRCPRVLSSKTINRDLARVTESPEILSSRGSKSPECFRQQSRERSTSSWRKV